MNPDHLLSNYLVKIKELFSSIAFLETQNPDDCEDAELEKKFQTIISKLKLLEIIHNKYVLGVSGFQGSGKTTLMKWFLFDNPDQSEWIPDPLGTGENLPVLLTCEDDRNEVEATLFVVDRKKDDYSIVEERKIPTPEACKEILKNPDTNFIMVELKLPIPKSIIDSTKNYFLDNTSFLLMPGFEESYDGMSEDKIYRQDYMKMALAACANTLLVIDPTSIAKGNQENILKEIMEMFGETNALYILSHKDLSPSKEAFNRLLKYEIPKNRIIETGTMTDIFTRKHVDNWRKELYCTICNNANNKNTLRDIQRNNIKTVVREVNRLIREVIDIKDLGWSKLNEEELKKRKLFEEYDNSIRKIRERFFQNYDSEVNSIIDNVIINIDHHLKTKKHREKYLNWFKEKIFGPETIKSFIKEFDKYFSEEINKRNGQKSITLGLYNKTLRELGVYEGLINSGTYIEFRNNALTNMIPTESFALDHDTINNIQFLIGGAGKKNEMPNQRFNRAMKIIPYIVFDMQRIDCILDNNDTLKAMLESKKSDDISDSFTTQFGDAQINVKSFLTGIAALAGADFLPDGKIDSIGGVMSLLFRKKDAETTAAGATTAGATAAGATAAGATTAGATAAGSASIAIFATGVVIAAILFQIMNLTAIGHNLKKISALKEFANITRDTLKSQMRKHFDLLYDKVRDFMEDRLEQYLVVDGNTGLLLKLENKIQCAQNIGTEIIATIRKE